MNRYSAAVVLSGLITGSLFWVAPVSPAHGEEPAEAKAGQRIQIFDSVTLTVPADWERQPPRSRIVAHEFAAPVDDSKEAATARVTMMPAGGDIDANIERWKGQFGDEGKAQVEKLQVAGLTVHLVQLAGSFRETTGGGPFSGGKTVVREDYGMLGAIIVMQDGRKYFIKLTGPKEVVDAQREDFKAMLKGLKV